MPLIFIIGEDCICNMAATHGEVSSRVAGSSTKTCCNTWAAVSLLRAYLTSKPSSSSVACWSLTIQEESSGEARDSNVCRDCV